MARYFQQAETAHLGNLNPCPVFFHGLFHTLFNRQIVFLFFHINKIDHDQPGQISHSQLFGNFVGCFQIGFECGFLQVFFFGCPAGVDIN